MERKPDYSISTEKRYSKRRTTSKKFKNRDKIEKQNDREPIMQTCWERQQKDFRKKKPMLTEGPYPAHDGKGKDNIGTADASTTGLCITLWQEATTR